MATWSSFEKDRLLAENWRKFVKDNPEDKSSQTVFGINSKDNTESLLSFLEKNQGAIGLTPEQVNQLVALMLAQTKEDDVVLEAIGGPQRDARTFSSDTTTKLNALIKRFGLDPANEKKLEKVLNRWAKLNTVSFEQGAASAPAPTPAEPPPTEEPKQTSGGIDYEPHDATDATPEKRADNLVVKPSSTDVPDESEAETDRIEPAPSTEPAEQPDEKNPAQTFVDFLNGIEAEGQEEITVELFNNFVRDLTSYIKDIKKKKSIKEIARTQAAPKLKLSASQLGEFLKKNPEYKVIFNRLRWADKDSNALDSFLRAFEQVAKSLPADTPAEPEAPTPDTSAESEPEDTESDPPEEEEPKQKTEDPTFTRRGTTRIKNYYNNLEIMERLPHPRSFNKWKIKIEGFPEVQSIEKQTFEGDNSLFVITLKDGQQFGLPKQGFSPAIEFAFEENGFSKPGNVPLKKVLNLAKIKDGKIIKKGLVQYHDSMEESLMLRWKTIAGIK